MEPLTSERGKQGLTSSFPRIKCWISSKEKIMKLEFEEGKEKEL
jgi:hypothetical protein